jgi:hypothetical protein
MLSENFKLEVESIVQVGMADFLRLQSVDILYGKESGHSMASSVEMEVSRILMNSGYSIEYETHKNGKKKSRAMSDFKIKSIDGTTYHLVNCKFSKETNGQPNICSAKRLLTALGDNDIDSYYMLKVKYDRVTKETKVYFVDVLDYIDCLTFNGGTGQLMLKEKMFYERYSTKENNIKLTLNDKKNKLLNLWEKKMDEHIQLKLEQRKRFSHKIENKFLLL